MKRIVAIVIFIVISMHFVACVKSDSSTCIPLAEAPKEEKNEILKLSEQVTGAIQKDDVQIIMDITSTDFQQNSDEINYIIERINAVVQDDFKPLNNFYLTFSKIGTDAKSIIPDLSGYPYFFYIIPISNKMAVLFSTLENGELTYLLTQTYMLENNKWKLNRLTFGDYAVKGMRAPEIYEKMLKLQENGQDFLAALYAQVLYSLTPAADMIQYPETVALEYDIRDVIEKANEKGDFPYIVETEQGKFEIVDIQAELFPEGIGCIIKYAAHTFVSEDNKIVLENEAKSIFKVIDQYAPEIGENFDIFFIEAYEEVPMDQNKEYISYTTIIEQ